MLNSLEQPMGLRPSLHPLITFCAVGGLLVALSLPAHSQENNPYPAPPRSFSTSDSSGPFLGNVQSGITLTLSSISISQNVVFLDTATRDIILLPVQINTGKVLKSCVQLSASMDKLSPFSGCSNINWKVYNRAIEDAKQLRRELIAALQTEKTAFAATASPSQNAEISERLKALEKTTVALEATTATLVALGQAMDKAR